MIGATVMGYIPVDAEWYIAEMVMEIPVHGARRNVLHRNLILLKARSPQEAYDKAIQTGQDGQTTHTNPKNQLVEIRFRGISKPDVVYDAIEDGAGLTYEELLGVPETQIQQMIPPKEKLEAFIPPNPGQEHDPDYRSKEVMEEAVKMLNKDA
jgi:hypothetical protein